METTVGYNAQELVRQLPREIKLTSNARRLLDHFAWRANEKDAAQCGVYSCHPSEGTILRDLGFSSATLYRALDLLEFDCGFYLITRRNGRDQRSVLYDLHIQSADLQPAAMLERKQSADQRLSAMRGKAGARKRNTSQIGTYSLEITSQNERYSPPLTSQNETQHLPKREVITSQNERYSTEITSQNERQNKEYRRTRNLEQGMEQGGEAGSLPDASHSPIGAPPISKPKKTSKTAATEVLEKHAEMWTATEFFSRGFPYPDKFQNPEAIRLMNDAVGHVGGFTRFKGFEQRPRDASFARKEFLAYCRNNDPAYEAAIGETLSHALEDKSPRAKAARARAAP